MFVIAGASGRTGRVVADRLLAAGKRIRVIEHHDGKELPWQDRGAEVAVASLDDEAAMTRALAGAEAAYVLVPEDPRSDDPLGDAWRMAHAVAQAVDEAEVPHVVLLSALGAQHAEGTGVVMRLHAAEERLAQGSASLTCVRAASFLDNWAMVLGATVAGALPTFLDPEKPVPAVATADVGAVIAEALIEGPPAKRRATIEVVGSREESPRSIAALLTELLGRPVHPVSLPLDAVVPTFTGRGASRAFAEQVREMFEATGRGLVGRPSGGARLVRGATDAKRLLGMLLDRNQRAQVA